MSSLKSLLESLKMDRFQMIYSLLFVFLLIGIPFAYSPDTRSVFEIHKLSILRITTILMFLTYLYESLFTTNRQDSDMEILGFRWKRTSLEWPILAVLTSLVISTIFSENIRISLVGTYDRWEGLWTSINYLLLFFMSAIVFDSTRQKWLLTLVFLVAASFATFYGIYQSLGLDNTAWSLDPESRVFATINNPVHFCAYMAMCVPLFLSTAIYLKQTFNKPWVTNTVLTLGGLCFYAMILSYSRASWLGLSSSLAFLYVFGLFSFKDLPFSYYIKQFLLTVALVGFSYLFFVFNLHLKSPELLGIFGSLLALTLGIIFWIEKGTLKEDHSMDPTNIGVVLSIIGFYAVHLLVPGALFIKQLLQLSFLGLGVFNAFRAPIHYRFFVGVNSAIMMFIYFISMGHSIFSLLAMASFIILFIKALQSRSESSRLLAASLEIQHFFAKFFLVISIVLLLGTMGTKVISEIFEVRVSHLNNVSSRIDSLKETAITGSARTSMWKSAFPWIKDYFWIGSGLDTVKYKFSTYRRGEYGILEGGHNYTPDRLHNDYLDKFVMRGFLGVLAYYGLFFGAWLVLLLRFSHQHALTVTHAHIFACLASVVSFQAQALFNFGVVPTFTLMFVVMGLAVSFTRSYSAKPNDSTGEDA